MMTTVTVPVDALNELIAERKRYEAWIRALEEKSDSTPAHILERVREDYTGRLAQVADRLAEHAAELQGAIGELEQRAAAAAVTVREREEARLEGELRASVGEYGDEKWEELRDRLDSELAGLIEERDSLDTELREMREIFAQAAPVDAGARAVDSPPVAESPAPGLADAAPVEPDPVQPNTVPPVANSAIAAPESAEMLNDLRSTGARQDAIAAEERSHPRTAAEDPLGELGYLAPSPGGAAVGQSSGEGTTSEAAKTLRCQECHAMNYPTEWYCERCGGELATL